MSVPNAVNLPLSIAGMEKAAWPRSASLFNPDSRNGRVVGVTLVCDLHHAVTGPQESENASFSAKVSLWKADRSLPIGDESHGTVTGITRVK